MILFTTPDCTVCNKSSQVELSDEGYYNWIGGMFAQEAFPYMSADEREVLITGTHPKCWDELFADFEE